MTSVCVVKRNADYLTYFEHFYNEHFYKFINTKQLQLYSVYLSIHQLLKLSANGGTRRKYYVMLFK